MNSTDNDGNVEMVIMTIEILDEDGKSDPEAAAELAKYFEDSGIPVAVITTTDPPDAIRSVLEAAGISAEKLLPPGANAIRSDHHIEIKGYSEGLLDS